MAPEAAKSRSYRVESDEGLFRGGLYELEQVTTFRVVDDTTGEVILTREGSMNASLDPDSGAWGEVQFSGVSGMMISKNGTTVSVIYFDEHEENLPLP